MFESRTRVGRRRCRGCKPIPSTLLHGIFVCNGVLLAAELIATGAPLQSRIMRGRR